MSTRTVAGHEFNFADSPNPACTKMLSDGSAVCGKRWFEIRHATNANLNEHHIAHTAHLTTTEIAEIMACVEDQRESEMERIWQITCDVASK